MKKSKHPNSFRTRFAKDIVAEVMLPERQTGKVAILAIGAPSTPYKKETLEFLASHGYVVIFPRYRGTWESAGNFLEKSPAQDIRDVITKLTKKRSVYDIATQERKNIRISAIHLFGGSFGGPAVLLNTQFPIVKKVIALAPVLDWSVDGEDEPFDTFVRYSCEGYGGAYRTKRIKDWQKLITTNFYNPVAHTAAILGKKVFIIHSKDDTNVPYEPIISFAQKTGATYYLKPRGGHRGFSYLPHKFYWKKIEKFLKS
ncbi:MAG: prolyl oligopeptidase family serine peptidase [Candidatus Moranbacteria bacterium]|nr:prolyl oligopeptidase family serine peptidase [Candidatus Moranbacteria bacterium]